jgi:hypothetical protein
MSRKRQHQVNALVQARADFAGIGTRKTKLALNKLGKTDPYAYALRVALEIEDVNLTAARYFGGNCGGYTYAEIAYMKKGEKIETLIGICESQGWVFGVLPSDVSQTTHIIYFDIPGVGQLSWHYSPERMLPVYSGKWDGKEGSTVPKLEVAVVRLFGGAEAA